MKVIMKSSNGVYVYEGNFALTVHETFRTVGINNENLFKATLRRESAGFDVRLGLASDFTPLETYDTEKQAKRAIEQIYQQLRMTDLAFPVFVDVPTREEARLWT
jgi:hypothetical protein